MISDPRNLRQISIPGLDTAAGWNAFAKRVNSLWKMRAEQPLFLTKGESWALSGEVTAAPTGPFDAPIYRVFVDRGDGWDWGSTDSPRAFYLAGTFTSYGGATALRAAKFYKSPTTSRTTFSSRFAALNQFNGTTNFIQTTRDGNIIYGAAQARSRNGAGTNFAWILDPTSGDLVGGFNAVSSGAFLTNQLSSIACVDGYLMALNPIAANIYDLSTGSATTGSSVENMHNVSGDASSFYLTSRRVQTLGVTDPKAFKKFNGLSLDAEWATNAGVGSGVDMFSQALAQKQAWNASDETKLLYSVATNEFSGTSFDWAGTPYFIGSGTDGAVLGVTSKGEFYLSFGFTRDSSVAGCSPRLEMFCVDPDGILYFGGGVNNLVSSVVPNYVTPQRLYSYYPNLAYFETFDGFNGPVRDCQFFCENSQGIRQFIVVGDFTEYLGEPAPYMVFIDEGGNRLTDLEWL